MYYNLHICYFSAFEVTHLACCPFPYCWRWVCGCKDEDTRARCPAEGQEKTCMDGCCTSGCESPPSAAHNQPHNAQRGARGAACHLHGGEEYETLGFLLCRKKNMTIKCCKERVRIVEFAPKTTCILSEKKKKTPDKHPHLRKKDMQFQVLNRRAPENTSSSYISENSIKPFFLHYRKFILSGLLHKAVSHDLLLSHTFTRFPSNQQIEGTHGAKGDLLGQIVNREGPPVPRHHCLAQQWSGWCQLKLLALEKDNIFICIEINSIPVFNYFKATYIDTDLTSC